MKDTFKKLIENKNSTLILLPNEPGIDPVAAGLGLYLYLRQQKHDVSIACPSPMRVIHNQLVGVDKITDQLGNKNLVVKLTDYNPDNIDTVIWDIVKGEFHLNVVTKKNSTPPHKDQIKLDYQGIGSDFLVLLGGREPGSFPVLTDEHALETPVSNNESKIEIAHIGTHDLQVESRYNVISLAQPASSVSELIADIIDIAELEAETDIATNLLTGIYEGSSNFTSNFVSASTFEKVAALMRMGAKLQQQNGQHLAPQPSQQPRKLDSPLPNITLGDYKEVPVGETVNPPKEWTQAPKIYKGTSVS